MFKYKHQPEHTKVSHTGTVAGQQTSNVTNEIADVSSRTISGVVAVPERISSVAKCWEAPLRTIPYASQTHT